MDTNVLFDRIINAVHTDGVSVIGIDGLGGAGKSTISEKLCRNFSEHGFHTVLLHIDDFIHMRKLRYNSAYPDWQCYYDLQWRFDYFSNIINEIKSRHDDHVDIELYDKENDTYYQQRFSVLDKTIVIVEGIFLQREEYCNIFDYMIYIDIPEQIRLDRVLKRDTYIGDERQIIDKYKSRYFPAEHRYMEQFCPQNNADLVISE